MSRCIAVADHLNIRLTRTDNPVAGAPRCQRPPDHVGCHRGEGWIWHDTSARYDSRFVKVHATLAGTKDAL